MKRNIFKNSYFEALGRSFLLCIPLFIIGSIALVIKEFPINAYQDFLDKYGTITKILDAISNGSFNIISLVLVICIPFSYGKMKNLSNYKLFFLTIACICSYFALVYDKNLENLFSLTHLFTSIIVCYIVCKLFILLEKYNPFNKKVISANTDYIYHESVSSLLSLAVIIVLFAIIRVILISVFNGKEINEIIALPLVFMFKHIGNSFFCGFLYLLFAHGLWTIGIHGSNVLESVAESKLSFDTASGFVNKGFIDTFVLMGGCGMILALIIPIIIFSKHRNIKKISKVSLGTAIFNINELLVFGLPVVLNPIIIIPFILTPLVAYSNSYLFTYLNIVPEVTKSISWTTPIFFSGYLATDSWWGVLLQGINLITGILIYLPFVILLDKKIDRDLITSIDTLEEELLKSIENESYVKLINLPGNAGSVARLLISNIKDDIINNKFNIYYQGQYNNNKLYGAEALLRYKFNDKNIIPPLIIKLAKEGECIYDLEKCIFKRVHDEMLQLNEKIIISINVTVESFMDKRFIDDICSIFDEGLRKRVNIEITEESKLNKSEDVLEKLSVLSERGFLLSIDDFGMGHTSLLYLQNNCFHELKLDGALTKNVVDSPINQKIIKSISALSNTLSFKIVAEYVETVEQIKILKALGVKNYQGYYFSEPIPFEKFKDIKTEFNHNKIKEE